MARQEFLLIPQGMPSCVSEKCLSFSKNHQFSKSETAAAGESLGAIASNQIAASALWLACPAQTSKSSRIECNPGLVMPGRDRAESPSLFTHAAAQIPHRPSRL